MGASKASRLELALLELWWVNGAGVRRENHGQIRSGSSEILLNAMLKIAQRGAIDVELPLKYEHISGSIWLISQRVNMPWPRYTMICWNACHDFESTPTGDDIFPEESQSAAGQGDGKHLPKMQHAQRQGPHVLRALAGSTSV